MESAIYFGNDGGVYGVLGKNIISPDLLGIQYFFLILQTSSTVKNSENVTNIEKRFLLRVPIFVFEMKE